MAQEIEEREEETTIEDEQGAPPAEGDGEEVDDGCGK